MTAPRISDADLDWLACRYVLGELSGTELDSFEQLLAVADERACHAVVEAVMLVEGVAQIERSEVGVHLPPVQPMPRRTLRQVLVALACSAAAVVLAVGWLGFSGKSSDQQGVESASTVAALWIDAADAEDDQRLDRVLAVNHEQDDFEEEDAVPGWLLAAVTEQHNTDDGEEMMQD